MSRQLLVKGGVPQINSTEQEWLAPAIDFCNWWDSGKELHTVKSSGSTGKPKEIEISRNAIELSASRTNKFFQLGPDKIALLAMNANFIGAKMMIARAILGSYDLYIEPPGTKLSADGMRFDFVPLVPLQAESVLRSDPSFFDACDKILLGGAGLSPKLEQELAEKYPQKFYHGFGMTETLSHIALRKLTTNGKNSYHAVEGVMFGIDKRSCLWIESNGLLNSRIQTNDVVELHSPEEFKWLGRSDFVINSGGVKIHPEEIEKKLGKFINEEFVALGLPDERLGQKLVLAIKMGSDEKVSVLDSAALVLPKFHIPKEIHFVDEILLLSFGKIDRRSMVKLLENRW